MRQNNRVSGGEAKGNEMPKLSAWTRDAALIDGRWCQVDGSSVVENPATGEVIGTSASADTTEVDLAVRAAGNAFARWCATPRADRATYLQRLLDAMYERREELVATTVAELGAPVRVAREAHVDISLEILASYIGMLHQEEPVERMGNSLILREPIGVVACITPWNYPLYQLVIKVAAAVAAGCTVIVKPAELTPLTTYMLADAVVEAEFPPGVFNLVPGSGNGVGNALTTHPGVDAVSFTGSTGVGSQVAARAAATLKRVSLELGGKSASVVLPGADLAAAVRMTVDSTMLNTGQSCDAWTRLLVPESWYGEAVALAKERAAELVVGDPRDEATDLGPVISAQQAEAITGYLDRARERGAQVHTSHEIGESDGHFVSPAVVWDVGRDDEIVREEIFGPVLVVLPYANEDEAVELANDSYYGLSGAVWAHETQHALDVARQLRTGQVYLNGAEFNVEAPFGGFKRSGYGRELGRYGLEEFTEIKSIQT